MDGRKIETILLLIDLFRIHELGVVALVFFSTVLRSLRSHFNDFLVFVFHRPPALPSRKTATRQPLHT
jgi:hypothetical protein